MALTPGQATNYTMTLRVGGTPLNIPLNSTVTAQLRPPDSGPAFTQTLPVLSTNLGSNWPAGVVVIPFTAEQTGSIVGSQVLLVVTVTTQADSRTWSVLLDVAGGIRSALFDKSEAIRMMRRDLLIGAVAGYVDPDQLSDSYLWSKLQAAEADAARQLRVFLQPTVIVPDDAPLSEIQALEAAGTAYATEAAYDYDPHLHQGDAWAFTQLRQKPLISIQSMQFAYPTPGQTIFEVPSSWIRLDKKYAQLHLVPTGMTVLAPLSAMMLGTISGGRSVPMLIRLRYTAGLTNIPQDYPDLVDAVKKLSVFKLLQGQFLPQSGSISADGLSQSNSIDLEKWMHGPGGIDATFDKLYESIHGPRLAVLG